MNTIRRSSILTLLAFTTLFALQTASAAPASAPSSTAVTPKADASQLEAILVGRWKWIAGCSIVVKADHTLQSFDDQSGEKINDGTWEIVDAASRTVRFLYVGGGWVDTLTLSTDGHSLDGVNNEGLALHGTK